MSGLSRRRERPGGAARRTNEGDRSYNQYTTQPQLRTVKVPRGFNRPERLVTLASDEVEAVAASVRAAVLGDLHAWSRRLPRGGA